jgi:hypothetical protein
VRANQGWEIKLGHRFDLVVVERGGDFTVANCCHDASSLEALVTQPNTKFGVQLDLFYSPVPNAGSKSCIETPKRTIFTAPLLRDEG